MRQIIIGCLFVMLFTVAAVAQTTSGRLLGNITSIDGLIPGATITITDKLTKKIQTTTSNEVGAYQFDRVPFGNYEVKVATEGFKTYIANDVKIDANQDYTLNPRLEIGDISIVVTVEAGVDLINSSNAQLSTTVSPKQILDLPINGRNPLALLDLQAGVNATAGNHVNGQRTSSTNFTRDGINVQDNFIRTGGFVQDRPSVDDTGEFTVTTQNAGAELGNGGSAQVQLFTPRGGSEFHGAGYLYNRNSYFAANEFGSNATRVDRPFLNRNQFGFKVGGPSPVPGFGEGTPQFHMGKAFFFVNYERFSERQQTSKGTSILLPQFRNGTFTYVAEDGTTRTVNVLSGAGLMGAIPANLGGAITVDPVIQNRILSRIPNAGNGALSNGGLVQGFNFNQANNDLRDAFSVRYDVDITDSDSVYVVYKYNKNADDRTDIDGTFNTTPVNTQGGPTNFYLLSYNRLFGSSFTNEIRGAYANSDPFFNQDPNFPTDYVISGLSFTTSPESNFQKQGRQTDQYTIQDNASYQAGNHTFRFGLEFNAQRIASETNFSQVGIYNITSTANPATPGLGAALFPGGISNDNRARADALRFMLGGIVGSGNIAANFVNSQVGPQLGSPDLNNFEYETYGLYFSDNWRVTPELTLNLGMRWDYFTPLRNPDQAYLEPDLNGASGRAAVQAALLNPAGRYVLIGTNSGTPGEFAKPDKNNFGPVLGVAYAPKDRGGIMGAIFGNTGVVRGGFRIGYINDEYVRGPDNAAGGNSGLDLTGRALNGTSLNLRSRFSGGFGFNGLPGFTLPAFTPPPITFAQGNANAGNFFNTIFAVDPDLQMQRNFQYNFGFSREIGYNTAIEVRYVGGRSDNMIRGFDFNQINLTPNFLQDFQNVTFNRRTFGGSGDCPNPATGCRPVGAFCNAVGGLGCFLGSGFTNSFIDTNSIGQYALNLIVNSSFFPNARTLLLNNPNGGVVDLLTNDGKYRYDALQMEVRKRFSDGLQFQANYTFGKTLTSIQGDGQARFDPYLDNAQPNLEYVRADHDRTHTININSNYELPLGKGKRFANYGGFADKILGGWQFTSIVTMSSGTPISILDPNGTLNRTGRSPRQTAQTSLNADQIRDLIGYHNVNGTIYWINPSVIGANGSATNGSYTATANNPAFAGQVFFRNQAGQTGSLSRNVFDGPWYYNWDAGLIKNTRFGERFNVQFRAEAFNVLNNTNFFIGEQSGIFNIGSTNFGKITAGNEYSPRIMQFAVRLEF